MNESEDFIGFYDLERYVFGEVRHQFHQNGGRLTAFDFFAIVMWKSNRAKSRVARQLLQHASECSDLECAVDKLGLQLHAAQGDRERLRVLKEWGFLLPMASAILSVLWPEEFTVYDVRVCGELDDFHGIAEITNFKPQWERYCAYREAVRAAAPAGLSLRDKDRWLFGRSVANQLKKDIARRFEAPADPEIDDGEESE